MVAEDQAWDPHATGAGQIFEHQGPQEMKRDGSPPPQPDSKVPRSISGLAVCQVADFAVLSSAEETCCA